MPGPVPGIHVFGAFETCKTWMAGTSPAMTTFGERTVADAVPRYALRMVPVPRYRGAGWKKRN
jgi:hypothetical protein